MRGISRSYRNGDFAAVQVLFVGTTSTGEGGESQGLHVSRHQYCLDMLLTINFLLYIFSFSLTTNQQSPPEV